MRQYQLLLVLLLLLLLLLLLRLLLLLLFYFIFPFFLKLSGFFLFPVSLVTYFLPRSLTLSQSSGDLCFFPHKALKGGICIIT